MSEYLIFMKRSYIIFKKKFLFVTDSLRNEWALNPQQVELNFLFLLILLTFAYVYRAGRKEILMSWCL